MTFAEKLKIARMQAGVTQERLAAELGVSKRTIINYENSQTFPPIDMLPKIAKIFDASIGSLITENEEFIALANEKGGTKAAREATELVNEISGLFAGGILSDDEKDTVMRSIQNAYWVAKEENKRKYTPKKHRYDF